MDLSDELCHHHGGENHGSIDNILEEDLDKDNED
jgi:hypothetical protein